VRCVAAVGQKPDEPILAADGEGGRAGGHLGTEELVEVVARRALGRSGAVHPPSCPPPPRVASTPASTPGLRTRLERAPAAMRRAVARVVGVHLAQCHRGVPDGSWRRHEAASSLHYCARTRLQGGPSTTALCWSSWPSSTSGTPGAAAQSRAGRDSAVPNVEAGANARHLLLRAQCGVVGGPAIDRIGRHGSWSAERPGGGDAQVQDTVRQALRRGMRGGVRGACARRAKGS
jgi:hypothetical protein